MPTGSRLLLHTELTYLRELNMTGTPLSAPNRCSVALSRDGSFATAHSLMDRSRRMMAAAEAVGIHERHGTMTNLSERCQFRCPRALAA